MPQPQGAELEKIRTRREELRERYLRPPGSGRPPRSAASTMSR